MKWNKSTHIYKRKCALWKRANGPRQHPRINGRLLENKSIEAKDIDLERSTKDQLYGVHRQ